ncbi:hypothetical protein GGS20DRAFT_581696 [Poronia punctata]|nr:hypothetical protein GGS20DRAFT_581696 [Poronia punctata]
MAVRPGEENVATLFGDVHYFYGPPNEDPPHHRFDKGSYVYLFENANDRRARIEIANRPGTDDQDAFDGFLDRTRVRYSYKQECVVNITVDGVPGPPPDPSQWHLPTFDPRNENKYHYRLHSLDIYFWTAADALQFVNGIRRVLPPNQVEVADEPAPPPSHAHTHSQDINPLVQRLESAAISESSLQHHQPKPQHGIPSFAPPPPPGPPPPQQQQQTSSPASFVPMAYNPAAPPEAEKYQHREKTPPPEDDGPDPLAAALARDQAGPGPIPGQGPFSPGYGQTTFGAQGPMSPGLPPPGPMSPGLPPPSGAVTSPGFPPSQFGHLQRSSTMPLNSPGLTSPYGANFPASPGFPPSHTASFAPPPTGPSPASYASPPGGASFAPPPTGPSPAHSAHAHATPPPHPHAPLQSPGLPPQPPGGYTHFSYGTPPPQQGQQPDYGIHQQVYRPTSEEHVNAFTKYKPKGEGQQQPSKLGQNAERLERGVTGMLKKFEKKFG